MFTVHELNRYGEPGRELLRTEFTDIADQAALAIANHRWSEATRKALGMGVGKGLIVICMDGRPLRRVVQARREQYVWEVQE